jgi:Leucine carboxyl methyltransferase
VVQFFEVDFPAASAYKRRLVAQLLPELKRVRLQATSAWPWGLFTCALVTRTLIMHDMEQAAVMLRHDVAEYCGEQWPYVHLLLQGMRPVFVGADLGRTLLSAALAQAGHLAAEPTLFVAGDASCAM